jgi:hypothetical protein
MRKINILLFLAIVFQLSAFNVNAEQTSWLDRSPALSKVMDVVDGVKDVSDADLEILIHSIDSLMKGDKVAGIRKVHYELMTAYQPTSIESAMQLIWAFRDGQLWLARVDHDNDGLTSPYIDPMVFTQNFITKFAKQARPILANGLRQSQIMGNKNNLSSVLNRIADNIASELKIQPDMPFLLSLSKEITYALGNPDRALSLLSAKALETKFLTATRVFIKNAIANQPAIKRAFYPGAGTVLAN